jgi:hypothetical protein
MAPTFHGLCLLDWHGGNVVIVDPIVGNRRVPVGQYPFHCVASPDGTKLYVSSPGIYGSPAGSIVEVDIVAGKVNRTVNALGQDALYHVALSPDGLTLAAGTYNSALYVLDTSTLTPRRVAVTSPQSSQTWPMAVRFTDSALIMAWDLYWDRMYMIDAATATQLPWVMDDLVPDIAGTLANVSYSIAKRAAYVTRGFFEGGEGSGDLVVVDDATSNGSTRGGFAGFPFSTCLNPRDGKSLYVGVQKQYGGPFTLDAYDTQADSFTRSVYALRNTQAGFLWDLQILG